MDTKWEDPLTPCSKQFREGAGLEGNIAHIWTIRHSHRGDFETVDRGGVPPVGSSEKRYLFIDSKFLY